MRTESHTLNLGTYNTSSYLKNNLCLLKNYLCVFNVPLFENAFNCLPHDFLVAIESYAFISDVAGGRCLHHVNIFIVRLGFACERVKVEDVYLAVIFAG